MIEILDPTAEQAPETRPRANRPSDLSGATVALLDISKPRGSILLDRFEGRLQSLGATVRRYRKPTFSKPAPPDLRAEIAERCGAVIEALAD